jgi:CRP-like cAMP-binding protein
LYDGDHFGEIAILKNVKRTLSVRTVTDVKLFVLSRDAFTRILGNIRDYLKEDYKRSNSMDTSFESEKSESNQVAEPA